MPSWHSSTGGAAESVFLCLHGVGQHKTALKADLCVLLCPVMLQEHNLCLLQCLVFRLGRSAATYVPNHGSA